MVFKENDFVEIEFVAKTSDGKIFDSNIKEILKKNGLDAKGAGPFMYPLGSGIFMKGVDKFLIGKNVGEYEIKLKPEEAFGERNPKLIQMIPKKVFLTHNLNPVPGVSLNFDGRVGKILTVGGGRVMVDFNNPLAGKEVIYEVKVLREVRDLDEKIKALNKLFLRSYPQYEIKDKKLILKVPEQMKAFAQMFKDKYREFLGLELVVEKLPELNSSDGSSKKNETEIVPEKKEKINP